MANIIVLDKTLMSGTKYKVDILIDGRRGSGDYFWDSSTGVVSTGRGVSVGSYQQPADHTGEARPPAPPISTGPHPDSANTAIEKLGPPAPGEGRTPAPSVRPDAGHTGVGQPLEISGGLDSDSDGNPDRIDMNDDNDGINDWQDLHPKEAGTWARDADRNRNGIADSKENVKHGSPATSSDGSSESEGAERVVRPTGPPTINPSPEPEVDKNGNLVTDPKLGGNTNWTPTNAGWGAAATYDKYGEPGAGIGVQREAGTGDEATPEVYTGGAKPTDKSFSFTDKMGRENTITITESGAVIQQVEGGNPYRISREDAEEVLDSKGIDINGSVYGSEDTSTRTGTPVTDSSVAVQYGLGASNVTKELLTPNPRKDPIDENTSKSVTTDSSTTFIPTNPGWGNASDEARVNAPNIEDAQRKGDEVMGPDPVPRKKTPIDQGPPPIPESNNEPSSGYQVLSNSGNTSTATTSSQSAPTAPVADAGYTSSNTPLPTDTNTVTFDQDPNTYRPGVQLDI